MSRSRFTKSDRVSPSADRYRMLFDNSGDPILIIENGRFVECNQAAVDMLGYANKDVLLQSHPSEISPEYQPDGQSSREKANEIMANAADQPYQRFEWAHIKADGSTFPVEVSLTAIPNKDSMTLHTTWRDISESKQLEKELRHSQKMDALGKLTGGIAHDFNNLLTVILGNLQLIEKSSQQDQPVHAFVQAALDAGVRGAELTKRLLAFSRQQLLAPKVTNVNKLVTEIEPMLKRSLGEDISFKTRFADDLWLTEIDPSQLENAIVNLAVNARDAMRGGGQLRIETSNLSLHEDYAAPEVEVTAGDYVLLTVSDTGTGIPEDILSQVFDPFFTTKESGKGTGLGLSMVYGFVTQSKGHIKTYSEEGHGTTVKLFLPRTQSAIEDTSATSTRKAIIPAGHETILVVEDEAAVRRIAVALLSELGYRAVEASTGAEALAILSDDEDIDLVFSDIVMPGGMTGIGLARHVHQNYPHLKVMLTSGYIDTDIVDSNFLQSGEVVLNKPYQREELAHAVRDVLDKE